MLCWAVKDEKACCAVPGGGGPERVIMWGVWGCVLDLGLHLLGSDIRFLHSFVL